MVLWSWRPLLLWMSQETPLPTGVPVHDLRDDEVGRGLGYAPFGPLLQNPSIGNGMKQLGEMDVLHAKPCIPQQQKAVLASWGVCQWLHMVVMHFLHLVAYLWHLKGCGHLLGKLFVICVAGDLCELLPPKHCMYIPSGPLYPIWDVQGGGLWIFACWWWWK